MKLIRYINRFFSQPPAGIPAPQAEASQLTSSFRFAYDGCIDPP